MQSGQTAPGEGRWSRFWHDAVVCLLSSTMLGAGCVFEEGSAHGLSRLPTVVGYVGLLLIAAGLVTPGLLIRNFYRRRLGLPESIVVGAAALGFFFGSYGGIQISEAILARMCSQDERSPACLRNSTARRTRTRSGDADPMKGPAAGPKSPSSLPRSQVSPSP
jgi:hypothetical protein